VNTFITDIFTPLCALRSIKSWKKKMGKERKRKKKIEDELRLFLPLEQWASVSARAAPIRRVR